MLKGLFVKTKPLGRSLRFVAIWARSPLKIGSLVPSSKGLANAMAAQVDLSIDGPVIELGAGTGVVTQALLSAGVSEERLIVVERNPDMLAMMKKNYPSLNIVQADALELEKLLKNIKSNKAAAIVSSLPLLSMPKAVRDTIIRQMAGAISPQGKIIQFTYGPQPPINTGHTESLKLYGAKEKFVLTNVPPAHVWVYRSCRRSKK